MESERGGGRHRMPLPPFARRLCRPGGAIGKAVVTGQERMARGVPRGGVRRDMAVWQGEKAEQRGVPARLRDA